MTVDLVTVNLLSDQQVDSIYSIGTLEKQMIHVLVGMEQSRAGWGEISLHHSEQSTS
jgi:hypothetical protein